VENPADGHIRLSKHRNQYQVNGSEVDIEMKLEPGEDALVQIPAIDCMMPELEHWKFQFGKSCHDQDEEPTSPGIGYVDNERDSDHELVPMLWHERSPFADFSGFGQALGEDLSSSCSSGSCPERNEIASQSTSGRGEEMKRMFSREALEGALGGSVALKEPERLWQWLEELDFDEGEDETMDKAFGSTGPSCASFVIDEDVKQMFSPEAWEEMH